MPTLLHSSSLLLLATLTLSLPSSPLVPISTPAQTITTPSLSLIANTSGSTDAITALLDADARVDPTAPDLPFHIIAASGCTDIISLLTRSYPDLAWAGAATPDGRIPVHAVATVGNLDVVHLCITSSGGDLDWANSHGKMEMGDGRLYMHHLWSPLHRLLVGPPTMLGLHG